MSKELVVYVPEWQHWKKDPARGVVYDRIRYLRMEDAVYKITDALEKHLPSINAAFANMSKAMAKLVEAMRRANVQG